jgi:D-tyrosyl-tRNA(Tyr) deacylase
MRAVVQRVKESHVTVDDRTVGKIGKGILIFLGVSEEDKEKDIDYMVEKISNLRIFQDNEGKMNLSLLDIKGEALVVSQFTLLGDCRKGRRPSYVCAAKPETAENYYNIFIDKLIKLGVHVQKGIFQAMMNVHLINDGPVTILIDSHKKF